MDSHVERKHKTEFKCKVCNFVTRTKALRKSESMAQYAPHLKHIFFAGIWKRFILYFKPHSLWKSRSGGGISPPWLKSFKNGGEFTPGVDITPLSFLSNLRRGGYHHLFRKLCKRGGFHTWGGYHPLVPIWPQSTGDQNFHIQNKYIRKFRQMQISDKYFKLKLRRGPWPKSLGDKGVVSK